MKATSTRGLVLALVLPLLVLLSGCVKFDATSTIGSDDKISASVTLAVQDDYSFGVDQLCETTLGSMLPGGQSSSYSQGGYTGCTVSVQGVAISTFATTPFLTIKHENGQYSFELSSSVASAVGGSSGAGLVFDSFSFAVTFPGEVLTHSGSSTVSGTTVTWTDADDLLSGDGLQATSKESGGWSLGGMLPILGIAAAVLVLGTGAFVLMRRKPAAAAQQPYPAQNAPYQPQASAQQQWLPTQQTQPYPGPSAYPTQQYPTQQYPAQPTQQYPAQPYDPGPSAYPTQQYPTQQYPAQPTQQYPHQGGSV